MTTLVAKNGVFRTPSGFKVKPQSYAKLEDVANTLRPSLPLQRGERFKLDCVAIFEHSMRKAGYEHRIVGIDEVDECAGFTIPSAGIVALREDVYDKLHDDNPFGRSTVVHELAHVGLQHHVTLFRGAETGHSFCYDSEWQAKAATAAIMMPVEAVRRARSAQDVAEMCGTSVEAATYRIRTLVAKLKLLPASHSLWEVGMES